jgi:hypothetical protein
MTNKKPLIINALTALIFFYLVGCFVATDFNLVKWDPLLRCFIALFAVITVGVICINTFPDNDK